MTIRPELCFGQDVRASFELTYGVHTYAPAAHTGAQQQIRHAVGPAQCLVASHHQNADGVEPAGSPCYGNVTETVWPSQLPVADVPQRYHTSAPFGIYPQEQTYAQTCPWALAGTGIQQQCGFAGLSPPPDSGMATLALDYPFATNSGMKRKRAHKV